MPASLVQIIDTSRFTPPSSDISGLTYLSSWDALLAIDYEVNEDPTLFTVNLFEITREGSLLRTLPATSFSKPSGVAYNPANQHLFFSDDVEREIWELDPGPDGLYDTADDIITFFDTKAFASDDPEGVTFDSLQGFLYVVDGLGAKVHEIDPGTNGLFDGVPPAGDDRVTGFDTASLGVSQPEGIAFDSDNGLLWIIGAPRDSLALVTTTGALVRMIDVSAANAEDSAGLAYAPGSLIPSAMSIYIAARGVDDGSDPHENDGKIYELSIPPISPGNTSPSVDAGLDQTITFPGDAYLEGIVYDDVLTATWGQLSGPETVTFADAGALDTTASFSAPGTYVLRLAAGDGELCAGDEVTIIVTGSQPPTVTNTAQAGGSSFAEGTSIAFRDTRNDAEYGPPTASDPGRLNELETAQLSATSQLTPTIAEVRVSSSADDAEEDASGSVDLNSSDLELVFDGSDQTVGMRFNGVDIPQGATILDAFIQFAVDEVSLGATSLTIQGEESDHAATFIAADQNITSRQRTLAAVSWSPIPWATKGEAGADQRTPDITSIIQEIVIREGWTANNSIALIITGTGEHTAEAYDGDAAAAPLLHVEWTLPSGGPPTGFDLTGTQIEENAAAGTVVGTLGAVSDPDVGDIHTFTLQDDASSRFSIVGTQLQVADGSLLDFETAISHDITVRVTDSEFLFYDETFTITVADANNEAPYLVAPIADTFAVQDEVFSLSVAAHFADDDTVKGDSLTFDATLDNGDPLPSWLTFDPVSVEFSGSPTAGDSGDIDITVTATDDFGLLSVSDTFQLSVTDGQPPTIVEVRVSTGLDEVEERFSGVGKSTSRDLEMVDDTTSDFTQTIGIRFNGLNIPQGATIPSAYVQFHAAEPKTPGELTLQINGEDADNAEAFAITETSIPDFAVSSRPVTDATVDWSPPDWPTAFEAGPNQRTEDISSVIEEIVARPGWTANNSIVLIITGSEPSHERNAVTYDGDVRDGGDGSTAPLMHVEWTTTDAAPDTLAPTPDPMTWASVPAATGPTAIAMTATTASDPSGGIAYQFVCTAGGVGCVDSAWQASASHTATGLAPSTAYTFQVKARDALLNETAPSVAQSATTDAAPDTLAPTPDPMTWASVPAATGPTAIAMTATTASDPSGGIAYQFVCTAGGVGCVDSAWQASASHTATGLAPSTEYTFQVKTRDALLNETAPSVAQSATTDAAPDTLAPTPDPMTWASVPAATDPTAIAMTATTASDPSGGIAYQFVCTAGGVGCVDSAWQASASHTATGLAPSTAYTFQVKARDALLNETAPSVAQSATTDAAPDTLAPTPDPMTWASVPAATDPTAIAMTATTASDPSGGIAYQFVCTAGGVGCVDSAWQASASHTATGLAPSTEYTFQVKTRDGAPALNETGPSAQASATTFAPGGTTMHIADLDGIGVAGRRGKWNGQVTITVHDDTGQLVNGAAVSGTWSAGAKGGASCTTSAAGTCTVTKNNLKSDVASVTFTVTDVTGSLTYDSATNLIDSVVVSRP